MGSGNTGGALGQRVAAAGHTVILSYSRAPAKLEPAAPEVTPDEFERMSRNEAERTRLALSRLLKNSLLTRLLKKVQMQGGARSEAQGVLTGTSQRRGSAPTPQMGLFQQPERRESAILDATSPAG